MTLSRRMLVGVTVSSVVVGVFAAVYVAPASEAVAIQACNDGPAQFASICYTELIERILQDDGLAAALSTVAQVSDADAQFSRYCHSNMHDLGRSAFKLYDSHGSIAISPELSYCGYGFYHGFMEEMFAQTGTLDGAHAFCDALGSKLSNPTMAVSNCYHGIGHGITDGYDPRTYRNAVALAAPGLELCAQISPDDELHRSCALGVFNSVELMFEDSESKLVLTDGPFSLCAEPYTELEKDSCYLEMSILSVTLNHGDLDASFESIRSVEPEYLSRSAKYISLFLIGQNRTAKDILAACKNRYDHIVDDCIRGITVGLIKYGAPKHEYDEAIVFCGSNELNARERDVCAVTFVTNDSYTPADRYAACKRLPTELRPPLCTRV